MNIVNKLTLRHIRTHKKRSGLTLLAIIVSVAMVTAVFTSALTFVNYFRNVTVAVDGDYHAYVYTDDFLSHKDDFETDEIDKYGVDIWYGEADTDSNTDNFEMSINAVDENYLELRNVKISEGRMPVTENEMLVHRKFMDKHNLIWKIGDKITLPVQIMDGQFENREFTIVGVTESNVSETDTVSAFVFATDDYINSRHNVCVYLRFAELDKTVFEKTEKLGLSVVSDEENAVYGTHNELLMYSGISGGETLAVLYGFCAIILLIIAVVSIFMIYDSFAVSYQERARYLGMLASVGATKRQKRNSIYFEGLILSLVGIPLGIAAGLGGIAITFKAISDVWVKTMAVEYEGALQLCVNPLVIIGTVLTGFATIFVSCYIPARKASKTSAIDAIRQTNTVKVKKSGKLRTSKLATKLLGFEGALAVKNFKRNGKRSGTIVFSLALSFIVFVSVANFSLMFADVMKTDFSQQADASMTVKSNNAAQFDKILSDCKGIDEYFSTADLYAEIDSEIVKEEHSAKVDRILLLFVDNGTLDNYAKQLGVDTSTLHNDKKPAGILHNVMIYSLSETKSRVNPLKNLDGSEINLGVSVWNSEKVENDRLDSKVTVAAQTKENLKNEKFYFQNWHTPQLILSIDLIDEIIGEENTEGYTAYITCEDSTTVVEDVESLLTEKNISLLAKQDATAQMESINNILTIAKVFVFGFISLITLISIMNIINTISNSMNERRREFAMIRSIGMTPKSFRKMIYYESFRYGITALLWAVPISVIVHFALYRVLSQAYNYGFVAHPLIYISAVIVVFAIIGIAIVYSTAKIKDDNIIETLKLDIN